jgi:hypothetical protein
MDATTEVAEVSQTPRADTLGAVFPVLGIVMNVLENGYRTRLG